MKTRFLLSILLLFTGVVMAGCRQQNQYRPDAKIIAAMNQKYPHATKVEWEQKQSYQVAEFYEGGIETEAWFDNNGKWQMTESNIKYSSLPQAIRTEFEKSIYSNWKKEDIDKIERIDMATVYIIELEKGGQETDLYYNEDGTLVKTLMDVKKNETGKYMPVSPAVRDQIAKKYPDANIIEVSMENGKLEIDIRDSGKSKEVIFDGENWVSTSWEASKAEVPSIVMEALRNSTYGKYRIDDIHFYETPENSYYYFDLEQGDTDIHLSIDPSGNILN